MTEAFICDAIRTPIGRYGGVLSGVRTDDLAALPIAALLQRNAGADWQAVDDVVFGCANQAGEDNRNLARMAALLAGLPVDVPGVTVNRLCGSGLDAVAIAARQIRSGEAELVIAGGAESMSRAPYVLSKPDAAFTRTQQMFDTTIGWRFVNPLMKAAVRHRLDAGDRRERRRRVRGLARRPGRLCAAQPAARARRPGERPARGGDRCRDAAREEGRAGGRRARRASARDEPRGAREARHAVSRRRHGHGRQRLRRQRRRLRAASSRAKRAAKRHGLKPRARVLGAAVAGLPPRIMGMGPAPASEKLMARLGLAIGDFDVIELNEAFASQALAVLRRLGLPDDAPHVNPNGGAIALGHPLGMSGARLAATATLELERRGARRALCTMCIGVGQGIALAIERVA